MKPPSRILLWWDRKPKRSLSPFSGAVLAGLLFLPFIAHADCRHSKCSVDLRNAPERSTKVIIQYNADTDASDEAKVAAHGGNFKAHLHGIHAAAAEMTPSQIEALAADKKILRITLDHPVGGRFAPGPGGAAIESVSTTPEYTAEPINAPAVWAKGYDGTGIGVAVIDSGINPVPDLAWIGPAPKGAGGNRIVYSQSFVLKSDGSLDKATNDPYGHGTHVAGLAGGNGAQSDDKKDTRTFVGIAPNVNLINLRVLDANGAGTDSQVIAAIQTAIALKNTYNIRVINLSLGRPITESYAQDPLCQAVEQAWRAGIFVVASAGNMGRNLALNLEGYGTIEAPGNDPYVMTVGAVRTMGTATNTDDAMASYSSKGPSFLDQVVKPDLVAPGNLVTSLMQGKPVLQVNNPTFYTPVAFYQPAPNYTTPSPAYMPLSGTSMSAGVVSGAAALLIQANPNLSPDQIKAVLMQTANKSVLPQTSSVMTVHLPTSRITMCSR